MKRILAAMAIVGMALSVTTTKADALPETFGEIYSECQPLLRFWSGQSESVGEPMAAGWCLGAIEVARGFTNGSCLVTSIYGYRADPRRHDNHALLQAVMNYARDNPAKWSLPVVNGIGEALQKNFPCE